MERKLAAILSADVKGYSRLMGEDEEATIRTLTAYRTVMTTCIQQQRGRVVDSPGDNLLAEFASVVDAVRCVVEIQHALKTKNAALPEHRQMQFRIGINLGDVVVEGERIYGDGVNIAARLESLAEPGGICISGTVYDQIENKLPLTYEYLGEQTVKNIAKPVRVWRVVMDEAAAALTEQAGLRPLDSAQARQAQKRPVGAAYRTWAVMVVAGLVLLIGGIVTVRYLARPPLSPQDSALRTEAVPAALPLPDKPSIVVLPFVNMSEDPKQEYFSDGLTEVLTGDLSKISGLFVIARNSAFTYKGKAVKVQDVGREMGVRYVVEGSVLRADNQVRITAQLIDATTAGHLWSERYDRLLTDIFALQDEITQKIVFALRVKLTKEEQARVRRAPTGNLEAYDYFLRGVEYLHGLTRETNGQAQQMFGKAMELDPEFAPAYALLGLTYLRERINQWSQDPQALARGLEMAQQALALDDSLPEAHLVLGQAYLWKNRQPEQAIAEAERAIALAPNNALGYAVLAEMLNRVGKEPEEAARLMEKAMRLDPYYPFWYLANLGMAYTLTGRVEEAIAAFKRALTRNPDYLVAHLMLAGLYSGSGREEEARAEAAEVLRISPTYSLEVMKQTVPFKDQERLERFLDLLRKAGLK